MLEDKIKWNARYKSDKMPKNPSDILVKFQHLLSGGVALDIACGNGRNTNFLADRGFVCDGVDISDEALKSIVNPNINTYCLDLDIYDLKENIKQLYDVVINFYFLDRKTLRVIPDLLKDGGFVFIETFINDEDYKGNIEAKKILEQGELQEIFQGFDIILNEEKWMIRDRGEKAKIVSFIAQNKL
ncbi:class I SAM-dependent methyltransferase [Helicobacter anatolicus]|uniref:class I SAM-dependent methyltransferase n=1 Tax=Helicobacter anatolicus TaxID=2905874 RepID=UPI001E486ED5|nr:methyltransferase domain-containing protein [Helicobacter anatolicus]MCE3039564.1 methyltransferase domain-containing protein [Helicobacter anatolicus]